MYKKNYKNLTSLATCGSETQENVISDTPITSDGVNATVAPASWNFRHYKIKKYTCNS